MQAWKLQPPKVKRAQARSTLELTFSALWAELGCHAQLKRTMDTEGVQALIAHSKGMIEGSERRLLARVETHGRGEGHRRASHWSHWSAL